jgi:hypothetical protein
MKYIICVTSPDTVPGIIPTWIGHLHKNRKDSLWMSEFTCYSKIGSKSFRFLYWARPCLWALPQEWNWYCLRYKLLKMDLDHRVWSTNTKQCVSPTSVSIIRTIGPICCTCFSLPSSMDFGVYNNPRDLSLIGSRRIILLFCSRVWAYSDLVITTAGLCRSNFTLSQKSFGKGIPSCFPWTCKLSLFNSKVGYFSRISDCNKWAGLVILSKCLFAWDTLDLPKQNVLI